VREKAAWVRLVVALACLIVPGLVLSISPVGPASARALEVRAATTSPTALKLDFRLIAPATVGARQLDQIWTDGRWVYLDAMTGVVGGKDGILINERNGRQTRPSHPRCTPAGMGGPWIVFDCASKSTNDFVFDSAMLYRMSTGRWQRVELASAIKHACDRYRGAASCSTSPTNVGSDWIEFTSNVVTQDENTTDRRLYQNIRTGAVRPDPSDAHHVINLSSRALASAICAPLSVPAGGRGLFYSGGRFALVGSGTGAPFWLEHCGTAKRSYLCATSCNLTFELNRHLALWEPNLPAAASTIPYLAGVEFASGQSVQVQLPASLPHDYAPPPYGLSQKRLYVITRRGTYAARLPTM
jgi:hypothetical protein